MPINTGAIASLLRPGLAAVMGNYPRYPSQWSEIFDQFDSDKAFEQEVEMKMLGFAQFRPEGSPTAMDDMGQRSQTTYINRFVALGFQITYSALINNLYKTKFPEQAKSLRDSMAVTKEVLGASVLNNGISASFPIGDGQPFFSLSHPTDLGVLANRPSVQVDLNEASLEAAIITIQQWTDAAGLRAMIKPQKLIVPATGQFTAERLLKSAFRTNTPNNDISAIYNMSSIPQGCRTNQFLTANNAWFVKTDYVGLKHYVRLPIETDVYSDFSTDNLLAKAMECYSFGVSNFRSMYSSTGT